MTATPPADALLVDLGGVVMALDWDRMFEHWARFSGEPAEALRARFRFDAAYERHERGEISTPEYFESLRASLGLAIADEALAAGWSAIFTAELADTVRLLEAVRERVPLYAFSNTNVAHRAVWSRQFAAALRHFRRVFVSCEMGFRKPEREAFEHVAREIGVAPSRILFLDDTEANVEGARHAGLQAVHVRSASDVERALRPWLPERM